MSQTGRLDTPPLSEEDGNGLPQWSQSRPYDHIYISRKPRPVPAVGRGGELHLILPFRCSEPGHMAAYRIETIRKLKAKGIVIADSEGCLGFRNEAFSAKRLLHVGGSVKDDFKGGTKKWLSTP